MSAASIQGGIALLPSIERQPLYAQAYDVLRRMILSGRLRPGMSITEQQLATELQVSRTPVREALRRLEQDGLILSIARSRVTVRQLTQRDVAEIYQVRSPLECLAARHAAEHAPPDALRSLRETLERCEALHRTGDIEGLLAANAEFHDGLVLCSENRWLLDTLRRVRSPLLLERAGVLGETSRPVIDDHWRIYEAVAGRDPDAADAAMREHMRSDQARIEAARQTQKLRPQRSGADGG